MEVPLLAGNSPLTASQRTAVANVRRRAAREAEEVRAGLVSMLRRAGLHVLVLGEAVSALQRHAKVVLHFHPDRIAKDGRSVGRRLLEEGVYRSQFETGISSGSPSAYPGGERDEWERKLFGGAYHSPGVPASERPKYGALQLFHYGDGPSPRFGSCYFVLRQEVSLRSTLTYGDSHLGPDRVGTVDAVDPIVAALLEDVEADGAALGAGGLTVAGVLSHLSGSGLPHATTTPIAAESTLASLGPFRSDVDAALRPVGRVLDDYIEAQVHGPVELDAHVEKLVADPSFRGTETGENLELLCRRYGIEMQWHRGFALPIDRVPPEFRGPAMIPLARRIGEVAGTSRLDAASIGIAAASLHRAPSRWKEWGTHEQALRRFRQIWHVLIRFGEPGVQPHPSD